MGVGDRRDRPLPRGRAAGHRLPPPGPGRAGGLPGPDRRPHPRPWRAPPSASRPASRLVFDLRAWDTRVGRRARRRGVEAYLPLVERAVRHLAAGLDGCGVSVAGGDVAAAPRRAVRAAFDPAAAGAVELAHILGRDIPGWEHAGPVRAREHGDRYVHDGAASVSFVWAQAPRQAVTATVLDPLMRPGRYPRRVTCTYRPTPAARAMDAATVQVRRRRLAHLVSTLPVIGRAATAQDDRDAAAAEQATREVADGAGWVAATITVTTTAPNDDDPDQLAAAVAETEHAAGAAQLRLRRLHGLQAAGFAAGLPAGLSLNDLAARWTR